MGGKDASTWVQVGAPPGGAIRGLGVHDGALVALTSEGLFAGPPWEPRAVVASALAIGRLAFVPPPPPSPRDDVVETMAFAIAPDDMLWRGLRRTGLEAYQASGFDGPTMLDHATVVKECVETSRDRGATWTVTRDGLAARDFAFDAAGRVWIAGTMSLEVGDGTTWRTALKRGAQCVAIDAGGTIVVGTATTGLRSSDGGTFHDLPRRAVERGSWGSLDLDAENLRQIERGPDGTLWGRIADGILGWTGDRWASRNLGLSVIPRVGSRQGLLVTALAFFDGAAYAGTSSHGVFRRDS